MKGDVMENFRFCDFCGKPIYFDGFMIVADGGIGWEYYCDKNCLHSVYTEEEYLQMYKGGYAFYTTFEEV